MTALALHTSCNFPTYNIQIMSLTSYQLPANIIKV